MLLNSSMSIYSTASYHPPRTRSLQLEPLAEQDAIGQIGQRVEMRKMRDFSSALRRSVMSSCVATQPPSIAFWCVIWTERPFPTRTTETLSKATLSRVRAQYVSTSDCSDPVSL